MERDSSQDGLTTEQAEEILSRVGPNVLTAKKKVSAGEVFLRQFKSFLVLILLLAVGLMLATYFLADKDPAQLVEASLVLVIVFFITLLGFIQEYKAQKAIESLKRMLAFRAKVIRSGVTQEIEVAALVPGDIVVLEEGMRVPADIRLISVFDLLVNEAPITGESLPVGKTSETLGGVVPLAERKNMVFSGTNVVAGRGLGVVVATGDQTEIGKIAGYVAQVPEENSLLQQRLNEIGKTLGLATLGICSLVFVFIVFGAKDYQSLPLVKRVVTSFLASVSLAVAAIPEGLPAVVTVTLAIGTQRLLKRKSLVRRLGSVETLGATDIICTDKTGTLTKGEMTVEELFYEGKFYQVTGVGYEPRGEFLVKGQKIDAVNFRLLLTAGLECNNAILSSEGQVSGDPTEAALLVSAAKAGLVARGERVAEIPFTSSRKMMSVVVGEGEQFFIFVKGAPEVVLHFCPKAVGGKEKIVQAIEHMTARSLRVLGFAYRKLTKKEYAKIKASGGNWEEGLVFLGLQGMIDPPREEVQQLVADCRAGGIRVVMITGDHTATARAVGHKIGLSGGVLAGDVLDQMTDDQLIEKLATVDIYARVSPEFKVRLVNLLRRQGRVVAMTGDGVNDAPAVARANIGIAMGITGTDVTKEAADMILLDDRFSTVVAAVEEGRGIFRNIRKFVDYLIACNISEVIVVFFAVLLWQRTILSAAMILWINIVTDGLPALALAMDPTDKKILHQRPSEFQGEIITRKIWQKIVFVGLAIAVFSLGSYFLNLDETASKARGAVFTAVVFFELVYLFSLRAGARLSLASNPYLLLASALSLSLQLALLHVPWLAQLFAIEPLDLIDWVYIAGSSLILWRVFISSQKVFFKEEVAK